MEYLQDFEEVLLEESIKPYGIADRCLLFSKSVVKFVIVSKYERVFLSMFDQLIRSSTSIGANVTEAKSGSSKKDWMKFLIIALKSSNETIYWLKLIADTLEINQDECQLLILEAEEVSKIIARILLNAQKSS